MRSCWGSPARGGGSSRTPREWRTRSSGCRACRSRRLLEEYDEECARSDATIAAFSLDDTGSTAIHSVGEATLRWILLHVLEETARHAGHLDLIREMVDGDTGYY